MLVAIQSNGNALCEDNIFPVSVCVPLVQFTGITPFGRAVFLAGAAVFMISVV